MALSEAPVRAQATAETTRRGRRRPRRRAGSLTHPTRTAWALVRPLARQLPVFPYTFDSEYGDWARSAAGWTAVGLLAVVLLGLVLTREGRRWERIGS